MSGTILNENFEKNILGKFHQFLPEVNVINYDIDITPGSSIGQGYIAAIFRVEVTDKTKNKKLHFLAKAGDIDKNVGWMNMQLIFGTEIVFYTKIIPTFKEFQEERGVKVPFTQVPKCYTTSNNKNAEMLIFENLKEQGFVNWNKKKPLPEDHIEFILKLYGKYHALSYALKDQRPETFDKLVEYAGDIMAEMLDQGDFKDMMETMFPRPAAILEEYGHVDLVERYKKFIENTFYMFCEEPLEEKNRTVLVHGDCWTGNMLFKNDESSKLVDVMVLDWQLSRLSSPAVDLAYFFFATATGKILKDLDKYLKIYYDSLSDFMRELGSDPEKVFTFPEFLEHFRKYCKSGFLFALNIQELLYSDDSEILNVGDKAIFEKIKVDEKYGNKYKERVIELASFAVSRGIF